MRYLSITCVLAIGILFVLQSCKNNPSDSFDPHNGTFKNEQVNAETATLNVHENLLLAGTTEGAFKKQLDRETNWKQAGLKIDSSQVVDFTVWNEQEMLAAILYDSVRQHKPTLFKSNDSGGSWNPVDVNKPEEYDYFVVHFLELLQFNTSQSLVAYAGTIIESPDQGKTWSTIYDEGFFSEFLSVSTYHPSQIWTGGWTNIFSPYLAASKDGGTNWTLMNNNVYNGGDATCYDAILHPDNRDQIMAGMSIGIQRSIDGGTNWSNVFNQAIIQTLTHSAQDPRTVYASGRNADGGLFFVASGDFGESWEAVEWAESPPGVQVNDMVSVTEDGQEVLYFGTNQGVYSYRSSE